MKYSVIIALLIGLTQAKFEAESAPVASKCPFAVASQSATPELVTDFPTVAAGTITAEQLGQAQDQWSFVKELDPSYETQGIIFFQKVFLIAPEAYGMFTGVTDDVSGIPDIANSKKLKKHAAGVFNAIETVLLDFAGNQDTLKQLGQRHVARGVVAAHYDVVG